MAFTGSSSSSDQEENHSSSPFSSAAEGSKSIVLFGVTIIIPLEAPSTGPNETTPPTEMVTRPDNQTTVYQPQHLAVGDDSETSMPPAMVATPDSQTPVSSQPQDLAVGDDPDDHWTIKKTLHKSDVDGSSRLLLGIEPVRRHILPHIGEFDKNRGVELVFYDVDTRTEHRLTLKTWKTESYTLIKGWTKDFVRRRGLGKNDEIGLRWKENDRRFEFTILKKALQEIVFF